MESKGYEVKISTYAHLDIDDKMEWYEKKKEGLGMKFYMSFLQALEYVKLNPFSYEVKLDGLRKVRIKKYPYVIYYSIYEEQKRIVIFAVWGEKQDTSTLKNRLKN